MRKFAVIFLAALTALLSGCAYSGRTCARPAPSGIIPMHIVLSFPYNPEDPNHDYHADGYYLWEETENWTKEDWDAYFESDIDYDPPESVDVQVPTEGKTAIPD